MAARQKARPETIGDRIAQARRELGVREHKDITPSDLAKRLGVSQATVYRWEKDAPGKTPRDEKIYELARILGVTPGWLRYAQEPKHPALDESKLEPLDLPTTVKVAPRKGKTG